MLLLNNDPSFLISFHNPTPNPSLTSQVYYPSQADPYIRSFTHVLVNPHQEHKFTKNENEWANHIADFSNYSEGK